MWIEFKNYQENGIVRLKREVNELLDSEGEKVCIFKSPTGSGKTLMIAEFLKRLVDSRVDDKHFSFIWIAVHKLHDQSRVNLKKYYDQYGIGIKCSYFDDLEDRKIAENEILFLNWASINKKDNIYVRANEKDNNLTSVIARTKEEGRIIILIIDESHHTAKSDKSKELINDIGPKITVEVSATPQLNNINRIIEVELSEVKEEGMIKKEIVINPDFKNYTIDRKKNDKVADEIVLESALKKRIELKKEFESEGSIINPLILIQLPDAIQGVGDKKDEVIRMLTKYGLSTENGRLAVYLTGNEKINLENIEKNENEIEVMLFKQAIALGWDCPRASILVLFRQWKEENIEFSIQTLGRIMRMPEQKHYSRDALNKGYVFTSLEDVKVAEDLSKDYITVFESKRLDDYKNIDLISYHSKRFRDETRLSSDFGSTFIEAASKIGLLKKVSDQHSIVSTNLIASGHIYDADKINKNVEREGVLVIPKNEAELQNSFDMFVRQNLYPFAPELRSIKRVNDSIYTVFGARRNENEWPRIQAMVLAPENQQPVIDTINLAKEMYIEKVGIGKREIVQNDETWNIPISINYSLSYTRKDYKRSIVQPYYSHNRSKSFSQEEDSDLEVTFIEYLENAKQVVWWFKNGKQDGSYFAVPYEEYGEQKPFYVDFIVMLKDGRIGLFDTKSGITAETAKSRAEGLAQYISEQNKKNKKKLFGGIVAWYSNSWRLNDKKTYFYSPDYKEWEFLNLN